MHKNWFKLLLTLKILIAPICLNAEPFVVLSYNNSSELSERDNPFSLDPDYSLKHRVSSGEKHKSFAKLDLIFFLKNLSWSNL